MEGWIKLHRKLKDHWIWKSDNRLKWWIDILMTVNHDDAKVLIKGTLIECKRGQSIRSLDSWGRDWNVTKGAVRDFFRLLQNDSMLHTESLQITTRITVCNYEDYQTELHAEETQKKRNANAKETQGIHKQEGEEGIKNDKKEKEDSIYPFSEFWNDYGKKDGCKKCKEKWIKISDTEKLKIKEHIPKYVISTPIIQYRKNPLTYLNGEHWNDEITNNIPVKKFINGVTVALPGTTPMHLRPDPKSSKHTSWSESKKDWDYSPL